MLGKVKLRYLERFLRTLGNARKRLSSFGRESGDISSRQATFALLHADGRGRLVGDEVCLRGLVCRGSLGVVVARVLLVIFGSSVLGLVGGGEGWGQVGSGDFCT